MSPRLTHRLNRWLGTLVDTAFAIALGWGLARLLIAFFDRATTL